MTDDDAINDVEGPGRRGTLALLFATFAGTPAVQAQTITDWARRAPPLAFDRPVVPLAAPTRIGTAAWGGFSRLCQDSHVLRPDGGRTPASEPGCAALSAEARGDSVVLRMTPPNLDPAPVFLIPRGPDGTVGEVSIAPDARLPPLADAQRATLLRTYRAVWSALGLGSRTLAQGERMPFVLPDVAELRPRPGEAGLMLVVEGEAPLGGRRVIAMRLEGGLIGEIERDWQMDLDTAGRVAVDVETALLLAQATVARAVTRRRRNGRWEDQGTMVTDRTVRLS